MAIHPRWADNGLVNIGDPINYERMTPPQGTLDVYKYAISKMPERFRVEAQNLMLIGEWKALEAMIAEEAKLDDA